MSDDIARTYSIMSDNIPLACSDISGVLAGALFGKHSHLYFN